MKKILLTIIGTLTVLIFGIAAVAFATGGKTDWRIEREKARLALCADIGKATYECYTGSNSACATMSDGEKEYLANFNKEAYLDCVTLPKAGTVLPSGEIVEDETGIPEQEVHSDNLDPLLFGDEEGN